MSTLKRYYKLYPSIWDGYEIGEFIGSGSFGDVYELKKIDITEPSTEVVKEIAVPPPSAGGISEALFQGLDEEGARYYYEGMRQKALEEVAILKKFSDCPYIIRIIDYKILELPQGLEEYGWVIFVRMELLQPLKQKVFQEKISVEELVKLIVHLCSALEVCHAEGIIHRDIKPENIFYSPMLKKYKLGDFGIACYLSRVTEEKGQPGTLTHMAPEVYCGELFDYTSDLYAVGMILYKFLNENRVPLLPDYPRKYTPAMRNQAIHRRLQGEAIPLPSIVQKKPGESLSLLDIGKISEQGIRQLAMIAVKAIDSEKSKRYASATELKQELVQWQRSYGRIQE